MYMCFEGGDSVVDRPIPLDVQQCVQVVGDDSIMHAYQREEEGYSRQWLMIPLGTKSV